MRPSNQEGDRVASSAAFAREALEALEHQRRREDPEPAPPEREPDLTGLLAMQHGVGNASVARMLARVRTRRTGETYTDTSAELFAPALDNFGEFTGEGFQDEEAQTRKTLAKRLEVKEKRVPPGDVRIEMLVPRLQQAEQRRARASVGGHNVLGVFLGPEWYFKKTPEPYTVGERDAILDRLVDISGAYPKLLIVPGTIVFRDEEQGELGNFAPVFYAGALVTMQSKFGNLGDTLGYGDSKSDESHIAKIHGGTREDASTVTEFNFEYGAYRDKHKSESRFFQIDNVRVSLEICGDHGKAIQEIAARAPFGPGQGAHVQLVVAHGAGLKPGSMTTPVGGHSYLADADAGSADAEYGVGKVWQGGAYANSAYRGHTQPFIANPGTPHTDANDPDLMHGGVHPLPAGMALPVAPAPPAPTKPVPVIPIPVAPAELGLEDDLVASE
jgi:hypothetical protein